MSIPHSCRNQRGRGEHTVALAICRQNSSRNMLDALLQVSGQYRNHTRDKRLQFPKSIAKRQHNNDRDLQCLRALLMLGASVNRGEPALRRPRIDGLQTSRREWSRVACCHHHRVRCCGRRNVAIGYRDRTTGRTRFRHQLGISLRSRQIKRQYPTGEHRQYLLLQVLVQPVAASPAG